MPRKAQPAFETEKDVFSTRLRSLMDIPPKTSQEELANAIGVTRQAVSNYKSGQSSPDWKGIVKIANYFNVSADYLLGLSDVKSRDADLQSVCNYTGLTEKSVTNIKELQQHHVDYGAPHIEILNTILSSDRMSFSLGDLHFAIDAQNAVKESLSVDFQEFKHANLEHAIERNNYLNRELKFYLYDALENFKTLIDTLFSFRDTISRLDSQFSILLKLDDNYEYEEAKIKAAKIFEQVIEQHGKYQED